MRRSECGPIAKKCYQLSIVAVSVDVSFAGLQGGFDGDQVSFGSGC